MYTKHQLDSMPTKEFLSIADNSINTSEAVQNSALYHLGELSLIEDTYVSKNDMYRNISEVASQLPNDEFLDEVLSITDKIVNTKMSKSDIIELVKSLSDKLEVIKEEQLSANEYAHDEVDYYK